MMILWLEFTRFFISFLTDVIPTESAPDTIAAAAEILLSDKMSLVKATDFNKMMGLLVISLRGATFYN